MIFPPAFLDSSSCWNTNHNQLHQLQQIAASNCNITTSPSSAPPASASAPHEGTNSNNPPPPHQGGLMSSTLPGGEEGGGGGGGGGGGSDGGADGPAKPMSMSERARLARVPQPEPGLNCPRCDSTNTKFCYFNNYSLTQPRHFCRACRRYWTRGGALRNVPVGGGYRRHAKRAKPKSSSSAGAGAGTTPTSSASATPTGINSCNTSAPASLQAMLSNGGQGQPPSHHARFADFDPASLGLSFPGAARLLFADTSDGAYHAGTGGSSVHGNGSAMDHHQQQQWAQMQSFPFLHAMDHHHQMGPPATTMAMQGMFHLGLHSGGENGSADDHHHHQFQHLTPPAKRSDHQQQQQLLQDYTSSRATGMYGGSGDVVSGGYTFYSSSSNAAGN